MPRIAKLFLPLALLLLTLTASGLSGAFQDKEKLQVGPDGLKLYPRWNKIFKPLAELKEAFVGKNVPNQRRRNGSAT